MMMILQMTYPSKEFQVENIFCSDYKQCLHVHYNLVQNQIK